MACAKLKTHFYTFITQDIPYILKREQEKWNFFYSMLLKFRKLEVLGAWVELGIVFCQIEIVLKDSIAFVYVLQRVFN